MELLYLPDELTCPSFPLVIYLKQTVWFNTPALKTLNSNFHTLSIVWHIFFRSFSFNLIVFFKDFTYLFLERGERRERNINVRLPLMCPPPHWGPGPQPRHVPWLGIKSATPRFTGPHSIHWATSAGADFIFIVKVQFLYISCSWILTFFFPQSDHLWVLVVITCYLADMKHPSTF